MALTQTLQDNFNDNSLAATLSNWGGAQVAETNNDLEMTSTLASGYYGVDSVASYDLTASYAFVKIADAGNQSIPSFEMYFELNRDDGGDGFSDNQNILWFRIAAGRVVGFKTVAGSTTGVSDEAYSATGHKYLRIRESGGTTYWEKSSDSINWNTITSQANPITMTQLIFKLFIGTWQAEASTTVAKFDDLNVYDGIPNKIIQIKQAPNRASTY